MSTAEERKRSLERAIERQDASYRALLILLGEIPSDSFPPHVHRQVLTLCNAALQQYEQLRIVLQSIESFEQPPRSDL